MHNSPVLIGCHQITEKNGNSNPVELMTQAALGAIADAGLAEDAIHTIDTLIVPGMVIDEAKAGGLPGNGFKNVPHSVSRALGIDPQRQYYTGTGGNTPQMLVNQFAEKIANGDCETVLIAGGEALDTMISQLMAGKDLASWQQESDRPIDCLAPTRDPATAHEVAHGIDLPAMVYPLFENALRHHYQRSQDAHMRTIGEIYERFNATAAANPFSWFPQQRSAQEIVTVNEKNRYIGFPYTKYLNSVIQVNMAAALILTSEENARALGVAPEQMVYLHGCADALDHWYMFERENYYSSPALQVAAKKALGMAQKHIDDIDYFDIYSCFPSAVQIACDALGLAHDDPRGLSITGAMPYFGGPGNNYTLHSIATMMQRLREKPGSFGLLNANGWFITKHSIGVYSTQPGDTPWQRKQPADYQKEIDALPKPAFTETPEGKASIETFTVMHGRNGPERALIIGRLENDTRFIANTAEDPAIFNALMQDDVIGRTGYVSRKDELNIFTLE
jgi:acetyl-CoA C-acetyltransferase